MTTTTTNSTSLDWSRFAKKNPRRSTAAYDIYHVQFTGSFVSLQNLRRYTGKSRTKTQEYFSKQDAYTLHKQQNKWSK